MSSENRRDLNAQTTRAAIIAAGRKAFGQHGFASTSLSDIAKAAKVTTGALYHHFADKKALFRAVAEDLERDLLARIGVIVAKEIQPLQQLRAGVTATLDLSMEPHVAQIIIHDAPSVIGGAQWREIEKRYAFGALIGILSAIQQGGKSRIQNAELTASILLGALLEAANTVVFAKDRAMALKQARAALIDTVNALAG
jgi:AcrR family transcriptional regulator